MSEASRWITQFSQVRAEMELGEHASELRRVRHFVESVDEHVASGGVRTDTQFIFGEFPGIETSPWSDPEQFAQTKILRENYPVIRREALRIVETASAYADYPSSDGAESILMSDKWRSQDFINDFVVNEETRTQCPHTARVIDSLEGAHGPAAMFSILDPFHTLPWHGDGFNFILSFHVGLVVPPKCGLVVGGIAKQFEEGQVEVMNSAYMHTAWNLSPSPRMHLLVDTWHPQLTALERRALGLLFKDGCPC